MTASQRVRRDRALVAAAARAAGVSYSAIGRAVGLSRQRVKEVIEDARRELEVKTAGGDFAAPTYREAFYGASARRRKLRPLRD